MNGEIGSKQGMEMRNGQVARVGSTKRIQALNGMMHAEKPSVDVFRARIYTKVYKETEGQPDLRRRYKAAAEVFRNIPPVIYDHERLALWPASRIRGVQLAIERHANWLDEDLENFENRTYDPFVVSEEDKKEIRQEMIPYWKTRTVTSLWNNYISGAESEKLQSGGFCDLVNYLTTHGDHFLPDYPYVFKYGLKGKYEEAVRHLEQLDSSDPDSIDKREFYEGVIEVLLAVKQMAENYADAAAEKAENEKDEKRKLELLEMEKCLRHVPWNPPDNFYEALETVWFLYCSLFIEEAGPANTYGRFDQYMYPYYQKGIEDGTLTPELALEWLEEFYIKSASCLFLQSTGLAYYFGGYYLYPHLSVGGLNKNRQDASNDLSYLCLRAMRYVKTTGPTVCLLLHQKTPDDLLLEGIKLSAEGMGHPSFFNVETLIEMLNNRVGGPSGKSPYTMEQILELGTTIGCVEPGVMGGQYGHTDALMVNVAYAPTLVLTRGIKPEGTDGFGVGELLSLDTGELDMFKTYEDFKDAVKTQIGYGIKNVHDGAIIIEKIYSEKFQLPLFTCLLTGAIEKGKDAAAGGAICNVGPTIQMVGFGTLVDSMAAIKKVVYEDKRISLKELASAVKNNFDGYEDLRTMLQKAPKYGNDDDYADDEAADLWEFFADSVRQYRMYRGHYCDPAVQMVQANVGFGAMTGATANGRLCGEPLSDTMSASQQADINGPTAAARSYSKLNYPIYSNGTLLNMWVSKSELIKKER